MVPFSFPQPPLKSRVMKKSIYTPRPATRGSVGNVQGAGLLDNGVQRHAGLVGQTCRFAPIKKFPYLPMLPSKYPQKPNPLTGNQPAHDILHFLSVSISVCIFG